MGAPTTGKLTSMHFYAWKKGLKTGMYYLRTQPKAAAIQFTVDQAALVKSKDEAKIDMSPAANKANMAKMAKGEVQEEDEEVCLSCGA